MSFNIPNKSLPKQDNSWYLRTGVTHHFICKCGQTDKFMNVTSDEFHPNHLCSQCHNNYYIDSMMFLTNENTYETTTSTKKNRNLYVEMFSEESGDQWEL